MHKEAVGWLVKAEAFGCWIKTQKQEQWAAEANWKQFCAKEYADVGVLREEKVGSEIGAASAQSLRWLHWGDAAAVGFKQNCAYLNDYCEDGGGWIRGEKDENWEGQFQCCSQSPAELGPELTLAEVGAMEQICSHWEGDTGRSNEWPSVGQAEWLSSYTVGDFIAGYLEIMNSRRSPKKLRTPSWKNTHHLKEHRRNRLLLS